MFTEAQSQGQSPQILCWSGRTHQSFNVYKLTKFNLCIINSLWGTKLNTNAKVIFFCSRQTWAGFIHLYKSYQIFNIRESFIYLDNQFLFTIQLSPCAADSLIVLWTPDCQNTDPRSHIHNHIRVRVLEIKRHFGAFLGLPGVGPVITLTRIVSIYVVYSLY